MYGDFNRKNHATVKIAADINKIRNNFKLWKKRRCVQKEAGSIISGAKLPVVNKMPDIKTYKG